MFPKSRKELNEYLQKGNEQEMNLIVLLRALKAIEGITFEDIGGTAEKKLGQIYTLAHNALSDCVGCGCDQKKIFEAYKAMVHFGVTSKPIHRKVILPDGTRIKCLT